MIKAILAIFGASFLYEHPYITLVIVILIVGAGFSYTEQKNKEEESSTPVQPQNSQPVEDTPPVQQQNSPAVIDEQPDKSKNFKDIVEWSQKLRKEVQEDNNSETENLVLSLLSDDLKLFSFNPSQRTKIYDYHEFLSKKIRSDSTSEENKLKFEFIRVGIQEKVKEFYRETDLSEMTRKERIEFMYSIDFLKKKIHENQADAEMHKNYVLLIKNMATYILSVLNKEEATIYMDLMEKEAKEGLSKTEAGILGVLDGKIRESLQKE